MLKALASSVSVGPRQQLTREELRDSEPPMVIMMLLCAVLAAYA